MGSITVLPNDNMVAASRQASYPTINQLPLEILFEVIRYLNGSERRALRLASRACARGGFECLLHEIGVHFSPASVVRLSVLSQLPALVRHVRSLRFILPEDDLPDRFEDDLPALFRSETNKALKFATWDVTPLCELTKLDPSTPIIRHNYLKFMRTAIPHLSFPNTRFHNSKSVDRYTVRYILGSALPNIKNLERIIVDAKELRLIWDSLKDPYCVHAGFLWVKSGAIHPYCLPRHREILRWIRSELLTVMTSLRIAPGTGEACAKADTFSSCTQVVPCLFKNLRMLNFEIPIIVPGITRFCPSNSQDPANVICEDLGTDVGSNVAGMLQQANGIQDLTLQFSHDFTKILHFLAPMRHLTATCLKAVRFVQLDPFFAGGFSTCFCKLNINCFSTGEGDFMRFLTAQCATLKDLSIGDVQLQDGSWVSWFYKVRQHLSLQHVKILEPLCDLERGILLKFSDAPDQYSWTIRRRMYRDMEFGDNLGRICTIDTPLDSELRSSMLALLEQSFTERPFSIIE